MSANKYCFYRCIDTCPQPRKRGLTIMCLYFTKCKVIIYVHYKLTGHPESLSLQR